MIWWWKDDEKRVSAVREKKEKFEGLRSQGRRRTPPVVGSRPSLFLDFLGTCQRAVCVYPGIHVDIQQTKVDPSQIIETCAVDTRSIDAIQSKGTPAQSTLTSERPNERRCGPSLGFAQQGRAAKTWQPIICVPFRLNRVWSAKQPPFPSLG